MFAFIKQVFIKLLSACTLGSFGELLVPNLKRPIKCVFLNNQPFKARPTLVDINSYETIFIHLLLVIRSFGEVATLLMILMPDVVLQLN